MHGFFEALRVQRWDDHRYYHHSRINQSLHLLSALSFLSAYVLVLKDPAIAALIGWLVAMTTRQAGHFSSSRRLMTPSMRQRTNTRRKSRSGIICDARLYC